MIRKRTKFMALVLSAALCIGMFAGCGKQNNESGNETAAETNTAADTAVQDGEETAENAQTPDPVTIKVLMSGDKPNDWDAVLEEFYNRTKDTLNITFDWTWVPSADYKDKLNVKMTAGEEYDLVFDAPWMHLRTLAQDGIYADLSPYLNNDAYPGLKLAFPEDVMKYNKYSDINCALPLFFNYGGQNLVMYRQDWAKEWGIGTDGQINSHDELKEYLEAVLANKPEVIPIALKNNRGFYHLFDAITAEMKKDHIYQGSLGKDIFFAFKLNDEETEVIATALPGDPAEYWEPFGGEDFWKKKVEVSREWNKYCEKDSLNQADPGALFQIGKAAAYIDTVDAVPKFNAILKTNAPEAELGVYIHEDAARNMEKGVYTATVVASNCLCIPASSDKIDRTVSFLNWLFESKENHDLFEYGIEGVHWEAIGDDQYKLPEGVSATTNYNPNGWNLTWNPNYYRFSADYTEYALAYAQFSTDITNYDTSSKIQGHVFQSDPVKTEIAQCGAILGEVLAPLNHGILENPYQVFQDTTAQLRENDVQKAIDEWVVQMNAFLQNK